jgi:methylated-DNA-[protein]-cysteine S-methyltransferase
MVADDDTVLASGWTSTVDDLLLSPSLRAALPPRPAADLAAITKAVLAYHDGDLSAVDLIPVRQTGGPFLARAWDELRTIPAGSPVSYTELAARAGRPTAVRAAAQACARNAAALFVPCHRVIRTDGSLGGFRWGLPAKQWLLQHESRNTE